MPETATPHANLSISATARALAEDASLSVNPDESTTAIRLGLVAAQSSSKHSAENHTLARAIGDAIAVVSAQHNEAVHKEHTPSSVLAKSLFNEMERLRCEAVGTKNYLGVRHNLTTLWSNNTQLFQSSESDQLVLVFSCLTKKALHQPAPLNDNVQRVLARWQETVLCPTRHLWPVLYEQRFNQFEYAKASLAIIATINEDTSNAASANAATVDSPENKTADQETEESQDDDNDESLIAVETRNEDNDTDDVILADTNDSQFDDDITKNRDAPVDADSEANGTHPEQANAPYKSFSSTHDEVIQAKALCTERERAELRHTLDAHIERHSRVVGKLSGQLQRVLMAQQNRHWKFDLEEGLLDTSRLTRIVTQPFSGLSFKEESDIEFKNTAVTLLVDNSKSMLGKPIAIAASCADILSQTLERCGVTVEILGFTTTELHGGPTFNLWKKNGKPENPGRLNGLRHIVYKSADAPYRRAREGFGIMLHKDLLKQNIDGEALLWAADRLSKRPEERKILMVISDGAPIDTSTMSANKDKYLIDHLHKVIGEIEKRKAIQLAAIGIGHDVSRYYKRALTIRDAKDLGKTLLSQMRSILEPG